MNSSGIRSGNSEILDDVVLPNLDAAYRLARWLAPDEADAEAVVQEASVRALRHFGTFPGSSGRAWFLKIVRATCWSWHKQKTKPPTGPFDDEPHNNAGLTPDSEAPLLHADRAAMIDLALARLPERFRELLVLRDLEGLSYQELADILQIPTGTVMSRLSRARQAFWMELDVQLKRLDPPGKVCASKRGSQVPHFTDATVGPSLKC
jgi:RNA polymerase sigma-70 factor (ECF subfamily)